MLKRLAVGTAALLALAFTTATPASASGHENPVFPAGSSFVCDAPTSAGGTEWRAWITVTETDFNGVSEVAYSIVPESRSNFAMPVGTGRIQAVSYSEWIDDEVVYSSERPGVPISERYDCDYPFPSGVLTIRGEVRYLAPPTQPTFGEILVFCRDNAGNEDFSQWERNNCVSLLMNAANVSPSPK